jgi:Na+/H+-dicarboxylate symporter
MKKLALHWKILLGMVFGVFIGLLFTYFEGGKEIIQDWIKPFGKIFINSLKLIAIPLILAALIKGVSDLKDISKLSQMGGKTIGIYIGTTIIAVTIGLILVNFVNPGQSISESTRLEMVENYSGNTEKYKALIAYVPVAIMINDKKKTKFMFEFITPDAKIIEPINIVINPHIIQVVPLVLSASNPIIKQTTGRAYNCKAPILAASKLS